MYRTAFYNKEISKISIVLKLRTLIWSTCGLKSWLVHYCIFRIVFVTREHLINPWWNRVEEDEKQWKLKIITGNGWKEHALSLCLILMLFTRLFFPAIQSIKCSVSEDSLLGFFLLFSHFLFFLRCLGSSAHKLPKWSVSFAELTTKYILKDHKVLFSAHFHRAPELPIDMWICIDTFSYWIYHTRAHEQRAHQWYVFPRSLIH